MQLHVTRYISRWFVRPDSQEDVRSSAPAPFGLIWESAAEDQGGAVVECVDGVLDGVARGRRDEHRIGAR